MVSPLSLVKCRHVLTLNLIANQFHTEENFFLEMQQFNLMHFFKNFYNPYTENVNFLDIPLPLHEEDISIKYVVSLLFKQCSLVAMKKDFPFEGSITDIYCHSLAPRQFKLGISCNSTSDATNTF
jgi:hypothetical protein